MNKIIFNILRLINEDKYIEANKLIEEILKNNNSDKEFDENDLQYFASCLLACRRFDLAVLFFAKANNFSSAAFVEIIRGNLKEAQQLLHKKDESSVNSWCKFLIEVFNKSLLVRSPSFFQIRNFLETTIYYLLLAKNTSFINLLLKKLTKLLETNPDAEKYIAYAYHHFGDEDEAIKLLNNSLKRNPYDGEIYFCLAQIYVQRNLLQDAMAMLENANLFLPEHMPTKILREKVAKSLGSK